MCDLQFSVKYENKTYNFQYGSEAYIFHTILYNNFSDIDTVLEITAKVFQCYLKDENRTNLGALTDFIAQNWDEVKELSRANILDRFYEENDFI